MSKVKVGINGMGRIGRTIFREIFNMNHPVLEVVAVNNPGFTDRYVHLIKYDSCHGKFGNQTAGFETTVAMGWEEYEDNQHIRR